MALIPITPETHAKTRLLPLPSYAFAAGAPLVPISAPEIVAFCHDVPVVFVPEGENFTLVAVAGLTSDRNILIDQAGRWQGSHIPAIWRRGPFRLASVTGSEQERLVLCLDDSSPQISETEGTPLFDETGAPSPLLTEATKILSKIEVDLRYTRTLCAVLKSLELLVPWEFDIAQPDGKKTQVKGLFRVDEAKIATLTGDELIALRNCGGLATVYAHLLSLSKVSLLARITQQLATREQQRQAVQSNKVDLDRAFGIVEDDPFIF